MDYELKPKIIFDNTAIQYLNNYLSGKSTQDKFDSLVYFLRRKSVRKAKRLFFANISLDDALDLAEEKIKTTFWTETDLIRNADSPIGYLIDSFYFSLLNVKDEAKKQVPTASTQVESALENVISDAFSLDRQVGRVFLANLENKTKFDREWTEKLYEADKYDVDWQAYLATKRKYTPKKKYVKDRSLRVPLKQIKKESVPEYKIMRLYSLKKMSQATIARTLGLKRSRISDVVRKRTFEH